MNSGLKTMNPGLNIDEFCAKNDDIRPLQPGWSHHRSAFTIEFALEMMNYALDMMNCVFKIIECALKRMNFVLTLMNSESKLPVAGLALEEMARHYAEVSSV